MILFYVLCFLFPIMIRSAQYSTPEDPFYTAGVVEFRRASPINNMTAYEMLVDNLAGYIKLITSAEANQTDIIVFPENTLNNDFELTYVPDPIKNVTPCDNLDSGYHDFLVQLSCLAKSSKKYLVINVAEKENCPSSPEDTRPCAVNGLNKFNTNVVFDRRGQVISRYRKVHVYVEDRNTTFYPEWGTFETDFGIKFGHFICFDILFYSPAQEMAVTSEIRDFIFPNNWYSELPFLTAAQLQESWSYGNDVNLLAAGGSDPLSGSTGTGVYAGRDGTLVSKMAENGIGERKLYTAKVLKKGFSANFKNILPSHKQNNNRQTDIHLMQDYQIEKFKSVLIDFKEMLNVVNENICYGNFCCKFVVRAKAARNNVSSSFSYLYRLGVFSGDRVYEKVERSVLRICAIYACTNKMANSCGRIFPPDIKVNSNFIFEDISITGGFPKSNRLLLMPNSLDQSLYPLPVTSFQWNVTENDNELNVCYALTKPSENLLTFAIYGSYYDDSAATMCSTVDFLSILFIFAVSVVV